MMNEVNKTLYIPLYGKAYVSKRGLFISDVTAESIWEREGFALKGKARSKWLAFYMGIRAAVFDVWVRERLIESEDSVIIHIGCGLDSRASRVGGGVKWYDVDFADVIDERRKYFAESDRYRMIAADVREGECLSSVEGGESAIVVMEGVSMYLSPEELSGLINLLGERFRRLSVLMDFYTPFGAKMSRRRNPVNTVGVTEVFGVEKPEKVGEVVFTKAVERVMTPRVFIDELSGIEKFIFRTIYAGGVSKKIYKLFEYEKA